ncbi:Ag2417 [Albugo candida]|uniref:Ag2417 protein n=1 Tax=Albugo candida TaxID=65357 RepID=A0A024GB37_9STRA|nr:Ag2417 [Albugo candida]|eukprot:CCI43963.1 Ag2417 [Albugo candida]
MASALPKLQLNFSWNQPVVSCDGERKWKRKAVVENGIQPGLEIARKQDGQQTRPRKEEIGKQPKRNKTEAEPNQCQLWKRVEENLIEEKLVLANTPMTNCSHESAEKDAVESRQLIINHEDIIVEEGECVNDSFASAIDSIRLFLGAFQSERREISTRLLDLHVCATETLSDILDIIAFEKHSVSIDDYRLKQGSHSTIMANNSVSIDLTQ